MFDLTITEDNAGVASGRLHRETTATSGRAFRIFKRAFDILGGLLLLPIFLISCLVILALNPFYNKGSLFFVQPRMGKDCKSFNAIKFRSMTAAAQIKRAADEPLETDRITRLGKFMRKSRVDELPQVINVLRGEMSLIGPRPDYYEHAIEYLRMVPGYRERHCVRPGISGLAQTELGYIEGIDATKRKVAADLYYIKNMSVALELWIFWRTIRIVAVRGGS
ncbi:sugar transferase [Tropicibacter oceani]|uniref:Sugar transferase n=1 Tax=Tropicibacter oceani TaxID=3058420 RepID=A0ABY8QKG5_9RHOB|nr:sugar transferase [Tropicibacter oceani]WGW04491.1 sugar transferase [Tropicibacter oceani]